ncbi:uncharacterized protein BCR38DRAFT_528290 [Pseudomassariella vexata]|uniref:Zn(2)-C6 fungal-type domain-containing protein n=1 Tax=Pseudomassariella vexata TaxID=1141098 RepID=A0A1Y2DCB5_9PEZI|nr:uncharacterized protein BCR38DRAFT_528290 [Pseudomassariella vexata]ORY56910.1 hypothetical protein BCR38DRAFT_528290 [Pseudomassariella vexata]
MEPHPPVSVSEARLAERRISRINRACITCRIRKQRCPPPVSNAPSQAPCQRCVRHGITCSFETDQPPSQQEEPSPTALAQVVVGLQRRLNAHEERIAELERGGVRHARDSRPSSRGKGRNGVSHGRFHSLSTAVATPDAPKSTYQETPDIDTKRSLGSRFDMTRLELASPIATLRSLGALSEDKSDSGSYSRSSAAVDGGEEDELSPYDPIALRLLSVQEAQHALDIYFRHCHQWAPILNEDLRHPGMDLRRSNPTLFLAILAVGARFWRDNGLHPRYFDLIALCDAAISRLLLCPTPADASLGSIQALMLYLQWMPCGRKDTFGRFSEEVNSHTKKFRTRYNDMSAWAIFGLAVRYATFLSLEKSALAPFRKDVQSTPSRNDMDRMRVWLNLITYDCNLTLASGLTASLDPTLTGQVARGFCSHHFAQTPGDVRYAALVELACIMRRAKHVDGTPTNRQPDVASLNNANVEMNNWERHWLGRLRHTDLQHTQLPFTSLRWYRLALNSSLLRPLLSSTRSRDQPIQVWTLSFLEISLTAAAQILFSLLTTASEYVWRLDSQNLSSFPDGPFIVDQASRTSLHHAVDSTWVSHTFALTFLVLCYIRGTIDHDLRICSLSTTAPFTTRAPSKPQPSSILARLARLALDIFSDESETSDFRPEGDFSAIVRNAASLVLDRGDEHAGVAQDPFNPAVQSLFDMMNDSVFDWTAYVGDEASLGSSW